MALSAQGWPELSTYGDPSRSYSSGQISTYTGKPSSSTVWAITQAGNAACASVCPTTWIGPVRASTSQ